MAINITSTQRILYTMRNEGKSDSELQLYAMQIAQKIQAIPPNASPRLLAQGEELLAEAAICKEILDRRKNAQSRLEQAHKEWKEMLPERKYAAVRNLKEAVTPNGQLVAAILEDEGSLSKQEISSWCDELAALGSSDLDALLSALVEEGVLFFQNGKYAVRQICTESLFPENPTEWALKQIGSAEIGDEEKVILKLIEEKETAICIEDFPAIVNETSFISAVRAVGYPQKILREKVEELRLSLRESYMYESVLNRLKHSNVLTEIVIDGIHLLYFPMLGERRDG